MHPNLTITMQVTIHYLNAWNKNKRFRCNCTSTKKSKLSLLIQKIKIHILCYKLNMKDYILLHKFYIIRIVKN